MMPTEQLNIFLDEVLGTFLDARSEGTGTGGRGKRGGRSLAGYSALHRLAALLPRELATVRLAPNEALCLADLLNGTLWIDYAIDAGMLAAEVEDADPAQVAHWDVDQAAFAARLARLSPGQALAVVDAVECAWRRDEPDMTDRLRAVGLVRE